MRHSGTAAWHTPSTCHFIALRVPSSLAGHREAARVVRIMALQLGRPPARPGTVVASQLERTPCCAL